MKQTDISKAAAALGRRGGSKTSDAKKKSSRENGKLGGRPTTHEQIVKLLRAGEAGTVGRIEVRADAVWQYYCNGDMPLDAVPDDVDYDVIAEYIIDANR